MRKYWFKPHDYGYGATPVTWEGWALVAAYLAVVGVATAALVGSGRTDAEAVTLHLAIVLVVTVALVVFARKKTEGAWRWRWGKENG
jgi:hypothetical protein